MPEDVTPEEVKPEVVAEVKPEPEVEHVPAVDSPRFKEVYARMRQAEQDRVDLQGRLTRLEAAAARPTAPVQPQYRTPEQLQALVDAGQMTPLQAADVVAFQRASMGSRATIQQIHQDNLNQAALDEVNRYIEKMPSLGDAASKEFREVSAAAHAYSAEVGLPVTDPRVQRRALRETFGLLEKVAKVETRMGQREIPHSETGGGGGRTPLTPADTPLKGVSQKYIDYWTRRGYTKEQMIEEAKFVSKEPRTVLK